MTAAITGVKAMMNTTLAAVVCTMAQIYAILPMVLVVATMRPALPARNGEPSPPLRARTPHDAQCEEQKNPRVNTMVHGSACDSGEGKIESEQQATKSGHRIRPCELAGLRAGPWLA